MTDWTHSPIHFHSQKSSEGSVWISSKAVSAMIAAAAKANRHETGGILIGRYGTEKWSADIVEATPKPPYSRSGWFWFQRSPNGLAQLLTQRWKEGLYYLGEWHFHPGGAPNPSHPDIRAMQKIARDSAYDCPSPILVILGGRPETSLTMSATIFRDGESVRFMDVEVSR